MRAVKAYARYLTRMALLVHTCVEELYAFVSKRHYRAGGSWNFLDQLAGEVQRVRKATRKKYGARLGNFVLQRVEHKIGMAPPSGLEKALQKEIADLADDD